MLLVAYTPEDNFYRLLRNNPETGYAERREFHPQDVRTMCQTDGALEATLQLAREVPREYHIVPNDKKADRPRKTWGRLVL